MDMKRFIPIARAEEKRYGPMPRTVGSCLEGSKSSNQLLKPLQHVHRINPNLLQRVASLHHKQGGLAQASYSLPKP